MSDVRSPLLHVDGDLGPEKKRKSLTIVELFTGRHPAMDKSNIKQTLMNSTFSQFILKDKRS